MPTHSAQDIPDASPQAQSIPSGPLRSIELVQLRVQHFHPNQPHDDLIYTQHDGVTNLSGVIHDLLIESDNGQASRGEGHDIALSNQASVLASQPLTEPAMELVGHQDEAIGADDTNLAERWFDCILSVVWIFFNPFLPN